MGNPVKYNFPRCRLGPLNRERSSDEADFVGDERVQGDPRGPGVRPTINARPAYFAPTFIRKYVTCLPAATVTWCGVLAGMLTMSPGAIA